MLGSVKKVEICQGDKKGTFAGFGTTERALCLFVCLFGAKVNEREDGLVYYLTGIFQFVSVVCSSHL